MKSIYINCEDFDTNVAIAEDGRIVNYFTEKNIYANNGNVYKGKISKVVSNMNFVFVEIGDDKPAFLSEKEYFDQSGEGSREEFGQDDGEAASKPAENIALQFKKGQEIMVQVIKEPYNTKGARLTTNVSLPGQHIVFAPFLRHVGVSKRITNESERFRLKKSMRALKDSLGGEFGIIVRTNAEGVDTAELESEVRHYFREWERIKAEFKKQRPPKLLYREQDLAIKVLREYVTDAVDEIITDSETVHDEVKRYMEEKSKKSAEALYYGGADHIFNYYKISQQVDGIFNNIVSFKKGGYIKIDVTEALTVIDINSGKFKGAEDVENSILNLNMNAAREVARQIVLRNIGGLIVVDFIDMHEYENRKKVKAVMDEELAKSKMYFKTLEISEYGLMEITRKRDSKRVEDIYFMECPRCAGRGRILNEESVCINLLKKIKYECRKERGRNVSVLSDANTKRLVEKNYKEKLREYERMYNKKVNIKIGEIKEVRI